MKLAKFLTFFFIMSSACIAQIVGEQGIGFRGGVSGAPWGPTYRYVVNHHTAIEGFLGYTPKGTGVYTEGGEDKRGGSWLLGVSCQPFIHSGDRHNGTNIYGDLAIRARLHNHRVMGDNPNRDGSPITPELYFGAGALFELSEDFEVFISAGMKYYNKSTTIYGMAVEAAGGFRIRLN
ncbi:MAG: hypothetical protein NZ519_09195 [Bacteroidia bacterium]|nr:hypothetical protein [Bacteroidia bacterium]MDW8301708.1 hypothetical protein [Bacteroidia bacterium]